MRAGGAIAVLLLLVVLASCGEGEPIPEHDLWIRVTADAEVIELGKAFPLVVERVHLADLEPDPFREEALAPLSLRLVETTRREDGRRVAQEWRYDAYCFEIGALTVPAPIVTARPRAGGPERSAEGNRLLLRVRPSLVASTPGAAELPGGLLSEPFPWLPTAITTIGVLAAATVVLLRRRRRAAAAAAPAEESEPAEAPDDDGPGPRDRALDRIARLRARRPEGDEEILAFYDEAAALVRGYLGERFGVRTRERTTEEVLADPLTVGSFQGPRARLLSGYFGCCDLVKFARVRPDADERDRHLDAATTLVEDEERGEAETGGAA